MPVRERILAGRYRLEDVIGRGGMSTVYRATDDVLGRTVAVKVLLPVLAEQDPTYVTRFEREARAAAALASAAVVTVYDTGVDEDGGPYIVMEYVRGQSLAEILSDGRPLEVAEAKRIAERVADALRAAHAAGVLHRDIKPANVMVADDGTVKVLDFGIARTLDGVTLTQTASVLGTAAYMAPERALGQPGDARADIYSLGCLLYAMLTGRPPFAGEAAAALLHQQVNREPAPPSGLRSGIPSALDALVVAMLAKAPEARPQTATEVRDRLSALSEASPKPPAAGVAAAVTPTASTIPLTSRGGAVPAQRTAPTSVLPRRGRRSAPVAAVLADHRWRAVVMAAATALVVLIAVALLAGGGGTSGQHRTGTNLTPVHSVTHPVSTVAKPPTPPTPTTKPAHKNGPPPGHHHHHHHGPGGPGPGQGDQGGGG